MPIDHDRIIAMISCGTLKLLRLMVQQGLSESILFLYSLEPRHNEKHDQLVDNDSTAQWLNVLTFKFFISLEASPLLLQAICSLLHLDAESLKKGLCTRLIVAGTEKMVKQENAEKARQGRDALAKALYSRLFDHVVQCVNRALRIKGNSKGPTIQVGMSVTCVAQYLIWGDIHKLTKCVCVGSDRRPFWIFLVSRSSR